MARALRVARDDPSVHDPAEYHPSHRHQSTETTPSRARFLVWRRGPGASQETLCFQLKVEVVNSRCLVRVVPGRDVRGIRMFRSVICCGRSEVGVWRAAEKGGGLNRPDELRRTVYQTSEGDRARILVGLQAFCHC